LCTESGSRTKSDAIQQIHQLVSAEPNVKTSGMELSYSLNKILINAPNLIFPTRFGLVVDDVTNACIVYNDVCGFCVPNISYRILANNIQSTGSALRHFIQLYASQLKPTRNFTI